MTHGAVRRPRTTRLPYHPPLAWRELAGFLAARAIPGVEAFAEGVYRRTVRIDGHPGVIELSPIPGEDALRLRAHLPSHAALAHVVSGARRVFDLDADPSPIRAHLSGDPVLRRRIRGLPGLRVPGAWDPFELGVRAILGQQVSVQAARTLAKRLVERFGEPVPPLGRMGLGALFPTPERLARAHPKSLRATGVTGARAACLRTFAAAVADGSVVFDPARSLDVLVDQFVALRGIGPWTAHDIAMRACGQPDAFPASDLGVRRALGGDGGPVTAAVARARAEAWRPWRAYAVMLLWLGRP